MPWAHLPEDFAERYDSAWVTCPNTLYDPQLGHPLYNRYLDELELADQLGFEGICVSEHHQNAYGNMPSPNIMAPTWHAVRRRQNSPFWATSCHSMTIPNVSPKSWPCST